MAQANCVERVLFHLGGEVDSEEAGTEPLVERGIRHTANGVNGGGVQEGHAKASGQFVHLLGEALLAGFRLGSGMEAQGAGGVTVEVDVRSQGDGPEKIATVVVVVLGGILVEPEGRQTGSTNAGDHFSLDFRGEPNVVDGAGGE